MIANAITGVIAPTGDGLYGSVADDVAVKVRNWRSKFARKVDRHVKRCNRALRTKIYVWTRSVVIILVGDAPSSFDDDRLEKNAQFK